MLSSRERELHQKLDEKEITKRTDEVIALIKGGLSKIIDKPSDSIKFHFASANTFLKQGKIADVANVIGVIYKSQKNLSSALKYHELALALNHDHAYWNIATLYDFHSVGWIVRDDYKAVYYYEKAYDWYCASSEKKDIEDVILKLKNFTEEKDDDNPAVQQARLKLIEIELNNFPKNSFTLSYFDFFFRKFNRLKLEFPEKVELIWNRINDYYLKESTRKKFLKCFGDAAQNAEACILEQYYRVEKNKESKGESKDVITAHKRFTDALIKTAKGFEKQSDIKTAELFYKQALDEGDMRVVEPYVKMLLIKRRFTDIVIVYQRMIASINENPYPNAHDQLKILAQAETDLKILQKTFKETEELRSLQILIEDLPFAKVLLHLAVENADKEKVVKEYLSKVPKDCGFYKGLIAYVAKDKESLWKGDYLSGIFLLGLADPKRAYPSDAEFLLNALRIYLSLDFSLPFSKKLTQELKNKIMTRLKTLFTHVKFGKLADWILKFFATSEAKQLAEFLKIKFLEKQIIPAEFYLYFFTGNNVDSDIPNEVFNELIKNVRNFRSLEPELLALKKEYIAFKLVHPITPSVIAEEKKGLPVPSAPDDAQLEKPLTPKDLLEISLGGGNDLPLPFNPNALPKIPEALPSAPPLEEPVVALVAMEVSLDKKPHPIQLSVIEPELKKDFVKDKSSPVKDSDKKGEVAIVSIHNSVREGMLSPPKLEVSERAEGEPVDKVISPQSEKEPKLEAKQAAPINNDLSEIEPGDPRFAGSSHSLFSTPKLSEEKRGGENRRLDALAKRMKELESLKRKINLQKEILERQSQLVELEMQEINEEIYQNTTPSEDFRPV